MHKLSESSWRKSCREHQNRVLELLAPGLTPLDHPLNTGLQRQKRQEERRAKRRQETIASEDAAVITALDPKHPVYNFLIEYYGLKGTKGVRRLAKWPHGSQKGILLEGATEQDFFTNLHTKGARLCDDYDQTRGVEYSLWKHVYGTEATKFSKHELQQTNGGPLASFLWYRSLLERTLDATPVLHCYGLHEWAMQYQPAIPNTESSLPPSAKYQSHLKLRVDRQTLNQTVEENTLHCTHVDAWKFFAKEALPLNQFHAQQIANQNSLPTSLLPSGSERPPWLLQSEQPACVHTTMDLLKLALKLGPFCESDLFCNVLQVTIAARSLDVAASPYDAHTQYGVAPIRIETHAGRNAYKQRQLELMKQAQPIRRALLENYNQFLAAILE